MGRNPAVCLGISILGFVKVQWSEIFSILQALQPLQNLLTEPCHNSYNQSVSHEECAPYRRGPFCMSVREHVQSFQFNGSEPSIFSGFRLNHMLESRRG